MLKQLIDWLEQLDDIKIIILDNGSDYPPLLEYYKQMPYEIRRYANLGKKCLWRRKPHHDYDSEWFIYTDPDILPQEDCPLDIIDHFKEAMLRCTWANKVGIALEVNDLPDHYNVKDKVIEAEKQFWQKRAKCCPDFFREDTDTTFALYKKDRPSWNKHLRGRSLRSDYPYVARHLPWYIDSSNIPEEEIYYLKRVKNGVWSHWHREKCGIGPGLKRRKKK
jgi:hypothetical protein